MSSDPDKPVAVVNGAGSGIGQAAAIRLSQAGYHLVLTARTESSLLTTAERAAQCGDQSDALVLPTDLSNPAAVGQIVPQTEHRFGRLDAIVNAAGYATLAEVSQNTPELWRRMIDTNLSYVVQLTAEAWPHLQRRGGCVVNLSSMASFDPFPGFAAYASAKVAVNMFTRCTAREGEAHGIQAVAVAPGAVETPMLRGLFAENQIGRDKTLDPDKVAAIVVGCITGDRNFTSGETIAVPSP